MKILKQIVFFLVTLMILNLSGGCAPPSKTTPEASTRKLAYINKLLSEGKESVRIVCFGDSITGKYYHTGGRRAYADLLTRALQNIYPKAKINMFNAGVSGDTTSGGVVRLEKDVLSHDPHLVIIMFGMNDIAAWSEQKYLANMKAIVTDCRRSGAETIICTQNSIFPTDPQRSVDKLVRVTALQREFAAKVKSPIADCYAAFEKVRERDATEWSVLMSDAIHPNLNGHQLMAQIIASTITGSMVDFKIEPSYPPLSHTITKLKQGEPIKILAPSAFDEVLSDTLKNIVPGSDSSVEFIPWPTDKSLPHLQEWSWTIRDREPSPDLVLVAIPSDNTINNDEDYIRVVFNLLNGSSGAGKAHIPPWDCLVVIPDVLQVSPTVTDTRRKKLTQDIVKGHDLYYIEREMGNKKSAAEIIAVWLDNNL